MSEKDLLKKALEIVDVITVQFPDALKPCYTSEELTEFGHELAGVIYGTEAGDASTGNAQKEGEG